MTKFDIPNPNHIREGYATDKYFERTEDALDYSGKNPRVVVEVTADQFGNDEYEVFAGAKDVAAMMEGMPVTIESLLEGQMFDGGPVMRIHGNYADFARHETSLLGFLSHASGVATAAREVSCAADCKDVYSFGTRHVHPMLSIMVERCALIGGMDGYSNTAAELDLPGEATGTMPHALMLSYGKGRQEEAWRAFNKSAPEDVPRIILADTFTDEADEAVRAAKELGDDLDAVRLDTTGSRRGNFTHIIDEVRYKLDEIGRDDVEIFVSGGLGPDDLKELWPHVDGFGVGSYVSNADPVDFSMDIVERKGEPIAKRGKLSGVKDVEMEPLIESGEIVRDFDVEEASVRCNDEAYSVNFRGTW